MRTVIEIDDLERAGQYTVQELRIACRHPYVQRALRAGREAELAPGVRAVVQHTDGDGLSLRVGPTRAPTPDRGTGPATIDGPGGDYAVT